MSKVKVYRRKEKFVFPMEEEVQKVCSWVPETPEKHGTSPQNNTNSSETHESQYGSQAIGGSSPSTASTISQEHNENKRPKKGIDLNKRPRQRPKRKKYWPKVVCEGKPKRTPQPKMPKPATPKCDSSEKNMSGKRKYVRARSLKNLETPSQDIIVTPPEDDMVTPSEDGIGGKVVCDGKPKRTPKPATPKQAAKKMSGKRKYVRKSNLENLVTPSDDIIGEKSYPSEKSCKRRSLNFESDKDLEDDSTIARATSQCELQNSCRGTSQFDLENQSKVESFREIVAFHCQVQNSHGKPDSSPVSECINERKIVNTEAEKSMQEYFKLAINQIGCQHNAMSVYKRVFQENQCLRNSRKLGPNFPKMWKKKAISRRPRTNMSSTLWSAILTGLNKRQDIASSRYLNEVCNSYTNCPSPPQTRAVTDKSFKCEAKLCQSEAKTKKKRSNRYTRRRNLTVLTDLSCLRKLCGPEAKTKRKRSIRYTRRRNQFVALPVYKDKSDGSPAKDALFDSENGSPLKNALYNQERKLIEMSADENPQDHENFQLSTKSRGTQEESINFLAQKAKCLSDERNQLPKQDQNVNGSNSTHGLLVPFEEQEKNAHGPNSRDDTSPAKDASFAEEQESNIMEMWTEKITSFVNLDLNDTKSENSPSEHGDFWLTAKPRGPQEERIDYLVQKPMCINDGQNQLKDHDQSAHGTNSGHGTLVPYQEQHQRAHGTNCWHGTLVPYQEQHQSAHGTNCGHGTLVPYQKKHKNAHDPDSRHGTLVPYQGPFDPTKKRRKLPKVNLDPETMRVWNLLMEKQDSDGKTEEGKDKEKWWEEERNVFRGRVDAFISVMHTIQGDRRFSPWKGSVVDSVVGVFLTQNVSDHLSSSAFMSLAANFRPQPISNQRESNENQQIVCSQESVGSNTESNEPAYSSEGNQLLVSETETDMSYGLEYREQTLAARAEGPSLYETEDSRAVKDAVEPLKFQASSSVQTTAGIQFWPAHNSESDLETTCTSYSMESPRSFAEHLQFEKPTLLQKPCSNRSSILSTNENPESDCTKSIGMEYETKNLCSDRINDLEGACTLEKFHFPSNLEADHLKILEDSKTKNVGHISKKPTLTEDSCPGVILQQEMLSKTQEAATVDSYASLGKFCLAPECSSQAEGGIEKALHTYNCQEGARTNSQAEKTQVDEPESLVDEMVQSQKRKTQPANSMNKKRRKGKKTNLKEQQSSSGVEFDETKRATQKKMPKKIEEEEWENLRRIHSSARPRSSDHMDSVDWEAVRCADVSKIAKAIEYRGQQNIIGGRIKEFLNRVVRLHKSIDLEWLRDFPPDLVKEYLLDVKGLGLKSVECVRLLALQNIAFPVDTNVGRIAVRLGWVPLQPLPEEIQIHLLEQYPVMDSIQKYLWPRLCTLDQRTLYELHYQMITFGKVYCTKKNPNCNACPMRRDCRHFASAFASAKLALPAPAEKSMSSMVPRMTAKNPTLVTNPKSLFLLEPNPLPNLGYQTKSYEPIIEVPASPEPECTPIIEMPASPEPECTELPERDIEDFFLDNNDPEEIPTIKLVTSYLQNNAILQDDDMSRALVALTAEAASIPMPKLKNIVRLRTEHQVYELPDSHPLIEGLDRREPDDPSPYLLAIWTPGETANSFEPPKKTCNSQESGELCNEETCFSCNSIREQNSNTIRATLLIPCRTATRGSFPLNGTYFQVNEVFADDESSRNPINVPREWIWSLPRRTAYFATSATAVFRGLLTEEIQNCFWRGFICVRGFNRKTRAPTHLPERFHCPASKMGRVTHPNKKDGKGKAKRASDE